MPEALVVELQVQADIVHSNTAASRQSRRVQRKAEQRWNRWNELMTKVFGHLAAAGMAASRQHHLLSQQRLIQAAATHYKTAL
jgi:hypothetical protein